MYLSMVVGLVKMEGELIILAIDLEIISNVKSCLWLFVETDKIRGMKNII